MDDATIIDFAGRDAAPDPLTALLRKGARELLHAAVVDSGHHPERAVQTGIGPVTIKVPKVAREQRSGPPLCACYGDHTAGAGDFSRFFRRKAIATSSFLGRQVLAGQIRWKSVSELTLSSRTTSSFPSSSD